MPVTVDNTITNSLVDSGDLPEWERENTPQPTPANVIGLGELQNTGNAVESPFFQSFVNSFQPDTTNETAAVDGNRQNVRDLSDRLATRGARGNELDAQFELPEQYSQLSEIQMQRTELQNAFNETILNEEGAVRPIEFITGRQGLLKRQKDAQVEALAAVEATLTGNIALAEQRVDKALDREFGDLETLLEAEREELELNRADLERKDKKATEELERALDERERVLTEQRDDRKEVLKLAQEAATNGAPNNIVTQMTSASHPEAALSLGGQFIGLIDRQVAQSRLATDASQRANIASQIAERASSSIEATEAEKKAIEDSVAGGIETISLISELFNSDALAGATGKSGLLQTRVPGSDAFDLKQTHEQLTSALAVENLSALRGLGAMSDREFQTIKSASTKLDLGLSEEAYKAELIKIQDSFSTTFEKAVELGVMDVSEYASILDLDEDVINAASGGEVNPELYF